MLDNIVTIHQPDFLPWLGFFNKISKSNTFIVLDHVENNPRDSNFWGRRVKIISNKKPYWLAIPLMKHQGIMGVPINQMEVNLSDKSFIKKKIKTINQNYLKTPYFEEIMPIINKYFTFESSKLITNNMKFIQTIFDLLKIQLKIVYSSTLNCEMNSTELLVELVKKVNGTKYIAGMGAKDYQNDKLFIENSIKTRYNEFIPIEYKQVNTESFIAGLSVIDALMNIGPEKTRELIMKE